MDKPISQTTLSIALLEVNHFGLMCTMHDTLHILSQVRAVRVKCPCQYSSDKIVKSSMRRVQFRAFI